MLTIPDQILETWYINHRVNLLLINTLPEEALALTLSKRGGGTVGKQLAHLYNMRYYNLESWDKAAVADLSILSATDPIDKATLLHYHQLSTDLVAEVSKKALANDGRVKGFARGVVPLLGYLIAHEGHHRGSIILTLKHSGYKLPKELKFGIWEWKRI